MSAEKDLPRLLEDLSREDGVPSLSLADEIEAVLAYLGPGNSGAPPARMCDDLVAQLGPAPATRPHPVGRILESAIAYGVGWGRSPKHGSTGWLDVWEWPADELTSYLRNSVDAVHRWMNHNLRLADRGLASEDVDRHTEAARLMHRLVQPVAPFHLQEKTRKYESAIEAIEGGAVLTAGTQEPLHRRPGTKLVCCTSGPARILLKGKNKTREQYFAGHGKRHAFDSPCTIRLVVQDTETSVCVYDSGRTCRHLQVQLHGGDQIRIALRRDDMLSRWLCGCGHYDCPQRHRIGGWDPGKCGLKRFLDAAVRGSCRGSHCKGLAEGMLFNLMTEEGFSNG